MTREPRVSQLVWQSMTDAEKAEHRAARIAWWTPERRAEQSARAQERFAAWRAAHPDRAAVTDELWAGIEAGTVERPDCAECSRPMHPTYDWAAMAVAGWRCRSGHQQPMDPPPAPRADAAPAAPPRPSWAGGPS